MNAGLQIALVGLVLAASGLIAMHAPHHSIFAHLFDSAIGIGFVTCALVVIAIGLVTFFVTGVA